MVYSFLIYFLSYEDKVASIRNVRALTLLELPIKVCQLKVSADYYRLYNKDYSPSGGWFKMLLYLPLEFRFPPLFTPVGVNTIVFLPYIHR